MNLENKLLDEWLVTAPRAEFPTNGKRDYPAMYKNMADYLDNNAHSEVNIGALIKDGSLLTDHGPDHVKMVIQRASKLVAAEQIHLTPYEVYILLAAVHFHDVGNMFGRAGHEINSKSIFGELGPLATTDDTEKFFIHQIAQAHGGKPADKIERLIPEEHILNYPVRVQLLAALLKFADELAEDSTRASKRKIDEIPKENQIYHRYAHSLKNVVIRHDSRDINLDFWLTKEDATQKYGKGAEEVYLIDEIWERVYKTHLERVYCMRFLNPHIRLDRINVKVTFLESFTEFHAPIGLRLEEKGYPNRTQQGIFDICPELQSGNQKITGESIRKEIEVKTEAEAM